MYKIIEPMYRAPAHLISRHRTAEGAERAIERLRRDEGDDTCVRLVVRPDGSCYEYPRPRGSAERCERYTAGAGCAPDDDAPAPAGRSRPVLCVSLTASMGADLRAMAAAAGEPLSATVERLLSVALANPSAVSAARIAELRAAADRAENERHAAVFGAPPSTVARLTAVATRARQAAEKAEKEAEHARTDTWLATVDSRTSDG